MFGLVQKIVLESVTRGGASATAPGREVEWTFRALSPPPALLLPWEPDLLRT